MPLAIGQKVKIKEKSLVPLARHGLFPDIKSMAEITEYRGRGRYIVKFSLPIRFVTVFGETTVASLILHRLQLEVV